MRRSKLMTIAFVFVLLSWPIAASTTENDAGSGRDAPPTPVEALQLPTWGAYEGFLRKGDSDWYEVKESRNSFVCVESSASGTGYWEATLAVLDPARVSGAVYAYLSPETTTVQHAIMVPSLKKAYFGLGPDPSQPSSVQSKQEGPYSFRLDAHTLEALSEMADAFTGEDAPGSASNGVAVQPGCFGGSISGTAAGLDRRDVFLFEAAAGDWITVSYGSSMQSVVAKVRAPDGSQEWVVESGAISAFEATQNGLWQIRIDAPTTLALSSHTVVEEAIYGLGLSRDGTGYRCRPMCAS